MTAPQINTRAMARRRRIMRIANVPMRALLSLPFPTPLSRQLMLLHYTGHKTGTRYRQPLSYVRVDGQLLTPGGGVWTRSLADGQPVEVKIGGRRLRLRPELVADPGEVDVLLGQMAKANPAVARFVPLPRTPDGHLEPAPLRTALSHGFRVVRWHATD